MAPPRRRGLGRGLEALLSPTTQHRTLAAPDAGDDDDVTLTEVSIDSVAPNPEQPRLDFDEAALGELADSIRMHGVLQPIVVERSGPGGFRLIAGERRLRAAQRAGLATVPAVIRPASESSRVALELALIENLQRADLSPIDEATAFARLGDAFGLTAEAIGMRVGRSRPAIANTLRLLGLPPSVQTALRERRLTAAHGRAILGLPGEEAQTQVGLRAAEEGWTVRDVEREVAVRLSPSSTPDRVASPGPAPRGHRTPSVRRALSVDDQALQRGLEASLGTPVRLERRRRGGRLVIDFFDDDQLDGLYSALGGAPL